MKTGMLVLAVALCLFVVGPVAADIVVWNGGGSTNLWSEAANWTVVVPEGAEAHPPTATTVDIGQLAMAGETTLIDASVAASGYQLSVGLATPTAATLELTGGSYTSMTGSFWNVIVGQAGGVGVVNQSGGDVIIPEVGVLCLDPGSTGTYNISGGTLMASLFSIAEAGPNGSGHMQVDGGVVSVGTLIMRAGGTIDITDGTIIAVGTLDPLANPGDAVATLNYWIDQNMLTAFGGNGTVVIDTEVNPGYVTVTAVPEPVSVLLLGLAGGLVFRTRRS